ncbi:GTPase IMAP family member 7-like [Silurus meridionalis]|uniref:GTPase IMAP family member 7-like n=1 Tax=Silurus meridionalis TaxID=175797 RepID=UPI001EEB1AF7|nr:GTPase IMAP family member 7-like [Silurus meridionalis]
MNRFPVGSGSSSVTRRCQKESVVLTGRTVKVVDTPDSFLFTHKEDPEDLVSEIEQSVRLSSPGVHACVLKPTTFTKQEAETVSQFKQIYGEEVFRHTVLVFTHGDQLHGVRMDMLIRQNVYLMDLVSLCGGRFTVLNNALNDRDQVYYLLDIIDRMVSGNENKFYTLEMLQETQRRTEEQKEMLLAQQPKHQHQMDLERAKRETEIRVRKEIEEEMRVRAVNEEEEKNSTTGENDVDDEEQKISKKSLDLEDVVKWCVSQQKYICVIAFFSLIVGGMFSSGSTDRWAFVCGCGLGGSAERKIWVLMWRIQFRTSCSTASL